MAKSGAAAKKTAATAEKTVGATAKKSSAAAKKSAAAVKAGDSAKKAVASAKKAAPAHKSAPAHKAASIQAAAPGGVGEGAGARKKAAVVAEETGAGTVTGKKMTDAARKVPGARAGEGVLAVRPGEEPWTAAEVAEARSELQSEVLRLRGEIAAAGQAITGLMRDSGDGAGDDQADTGTKNIAREHELALAAHARETLQQTEHALERLDAGTYGLCESCGNPIGKARMQAFPRATLCVDCKQRQERR
ncbi:TraR/DksA family transcriptional regulator [Streptomyces morookaense]|uniref:TraR/DksA family transcriptional regulator n=1 Tax=Streptomyces morookaense TaxID=1970 RepID=A0A7Y7E8A2_STRMO|nr:TraR/DksA family transcriptional regulator [Streptomyces morookaense]